MKNSIRPIDCKNIFVDRFNELNMKELGIELKHFAGGTAPESPSVLVNQEKLKQELVDKFTNFFNNEDSQGLEIIYLRSNYGNGKSHFLRTIHVFLNRFDNVISRRISLKQEKSDLKLKILEGIGQQSIKDCSIYFVNQITKKYHQTDETSIITALAEEFEINSLIASLFYKVATSDNISLQAQAIAVLKGNHLAEYLKSLKIKSSEISTYFYADVIRLICKYLNVINNYIVIMFDEYEHIYSWKHKKEQKQFFDDVKEFTDNLDLFKNLCFIFADSASTDLTESGRQSVGIDPAYASRKQSHVYTIDNISSEKQVRNLFNMIKIRYEKYYEIDFTDVEAVFNTIQNSSEISEMSNYRSYSQVIMKTFDEYRNKVGKSKKSSLLKTNTANDSADDILIRWNNYTSMGKKGELFDAIVNLLKNSNEQIKDLSKKKGVLKTINNNEEFEYHVVFTEKPNEKDFINKYNEINAIQGDNLLKNIFLIYPFFSDSNLDLLNSIEQSRVILYHLGQLPDSIKKMSSLNSVDSIYPKLKELFMGGNNENNHSI